MAQNALSEEYSMPQDAISADDLYQAVWKISCGDFNHASILKNHIISISIQEIPWSGIRHLAILGQSDKTCNDMLERNGYSAGVYISKDLHWLLLIHPEEEECLQVLDRCCSSLKVLEIYNSNILSLDLSSSTGLERLIMMRCAQLSCITGFEKLVELTYLTLVDCSNLTELPGIDGFSRLTTLKLNRCLGNVVQNLFSLVDITQLTSLRLSGYEALTEIQFAKSKYQLTSLSVIGCGKLSSLSGLSNLEQLTSLDVHDCTSLTTLSGVSEMANLSTLDVSGCGCLQELNLSGCRSLSEIEGLDDLSRLTALNLSGCIKFPIPSGFHALKQLKILNISECNCRSEIDFSKHSSLRELILSGCSGVKKLNLSSCDSLTALPGLEDLTKLENLNLSNCRNFSVLPNLSNLKKLSFLDLSDTAISVLPDSICRLSSLWHLNLSGINLQELPDFLPNIASRFHAGAEFDLQYELEKKFDELFGRPNDHLNARAEVGLIRTTIEGVDMSIFEQPYEMVVEWFQNRQLNTIQPLNEIKVVFLGDGEAGKSHTIARLMNDGGEPNHAVFDGQSTPGIVIRNKEYYLGDRKIQVHYWDFGGQEIMHSMHRIFLTGRTMYVILLNARDDTQSDRAKYWLHNVKSFAPDAPVLLVLNKIDQNPNASVDEKDLRGRYHKLTQVVKLSAKDFSQKEFNDCFTKVLLEEIEKTGFLDAEWPTTWTKVKKRLENMQTHYIMGDAYEDICEECKVDKNQEDLLHWFNDLGVSFCCCDEKDYKLKDYVILRPDWITNALYIILFNRLEGARNGRIPHRSIYDILRNAHKNPDIRRTLSNAKYSNNDIQYVLGVMHKFNLSLADGEDDEFIPMLCQRNSTVDVPYYQKDTDTLEFNMDFDYLPPNLLHRLMVERHAELDMENVWRTGARFQLNELNLCAVIVIDGDTLRFFIRYIDPKKHQANHMHRLNTYLTMLKAHVDRIVEKMGLKPPTCQLIYKLDGKRDEFDYEDVKLNRELGDTTMTSKAHRKKIRIEDILNQSAPDGLEDERKLLDAIQRSCQNIQGEPDYRLNGDGHGLEDKRNRRVRDDLFGWGYNIQDQSQRGRSGSGKSIGELDFLLHNEKRELWTAIEALRVSDGVTAEWKKHLNKLIGSYNFFGARFLYLLTYVDADPKAFERIWKGYQTKIPQYDPGQYKYASDSFVDLSNENSFQYVKVAKCCYTCGSESVTVYHMFVRIPTRNE